MIKRISYYVLVFLACFSLSCSCAFASSGSDLSDLPESQSSGSEVTESTDVRFLKVSANDTSGLHSILLRLIGDYNPIVTDHTYTSGSGYVNHSVDIQPDWSWILTAALFIIVIFCTFRFVGGLFSRG